MTHTRWLALAVSLSIGTPTRGTAQGVSTRDSAGIRIVVNQPALASTGALRVQGAHALQIGSEGSAEYTFNGVVAATRLRNGQYAIADNGSAQIRLYNADGRHVRTIGRRGSGPGEFENLLWIWQHLGDSVRAWDTRLTTFSLATSAVHSERLRAPDGTTWLAAGVVRGMLSDGSFFVYETRPVPVPQNERALRDTAVVWHVSRDGVRGERVGSFLWRQVRRGAAGYSMAPPGSTERRPVMVWRGQPFALSTQLATTADALLSTNSFGEFEWHERSPGGLLKRIVRVNRPRVQITPEVIRMQKAEEQVSNSNFALAQPPVARNLPAAEYPSHIPGYAALRVDRENRVWARHTSIKTVDAERWDVFRTDGKLIDVVQMPARFTFFDAGTDYVIGVWRDDDDVEKVRIYRMGAGRSAP